ncbi:MAG: TonB-dependent receptor [Xanthomonadales bacterium]|nr:TonB-dependent receptor [Xanthomonadales bacterium]
MSTIPPSPLMALIALVTGPALAGPAADASAGASEIDTVQVVGSTLRKAESPKYTEPVLDTPQTITVVDRAVIEQQNLLGLRDVLGTLPGITFGAGEGGGGYGDSITLRGYTASSDITTDGVRDSAQYTRSDTFNLESIELVNGANSAMSGAGSVGGNINLVSKSAHAGDASAFALGAGTDGYARATADANVDFDNGVALRLNAMAHHNDVPGRDEERFRRWGFAPSLAIGLGSDTRLTVNYLHQSDDNLPQYGVPYALNGYHDGPLPGIDPRTYFGYRNVSKQTIDVDMLTAVFERDFGDAVTLRSLGRLQRVDQVSNVTALQGNWCLFDGTNPYTGQACAGGQPAGTWSPVAGPRGYVRDTRNTLAIGQTDLTARFSTGAVRHALVGGLSFSTESFELDTGGMFFNADGSPLPNTGAGYPLQTFRNPANVWRGPLNYFRSGRTEGDLDTVSAYLFDTLKFGERWMLNLGARHDRNRGATKTWIVSTDNATRGRLLGVNPIARNDENLLSYRAGLVFKPSEHGAVYLAWSDSKTPSKASVNGSCIATSTTGTANCDVGAETAINLELGAKWEIPDRNLTLTAAVFRNERRNYRVADPGNPDNPAGEQQLDGRARVDGAVFGVAGTLLPGWQVFANYTWLDSEVLRGVSAFCFANPGAACGNSATDRDPFAGNPLTNTPKHSGSLWTTYTTGDWTFGYGATYQGRFVVQNNTLDGRPLFPTDAYWVHRAMVGYAVNDRLDLQLNLNNLLDAEYYTRIRNNIAFTGATVTGGNGWATPGEARSAVLTATWRF